MGPRSPANRAYPQHGVDRAIQRRSNVELRDLARKTIRDRPTAYVGLVVHDFGRLFVPGQIGPSDTAIALPRRPLDKPPAFNRSARDRLLPHYRPPARPPAEALHAYGSIVTMPRPLLAVALLLAIAALARRTPRRREIFLLAGTGTALMLGSVATVEFVARYLLPAIPLLALAGVVAAFELRRSTQRPRAGAGDAPATAGKQAARSGRSFEPLRARRHVRWTLASSRCVPRAWDASVTPSPRTAIASLPASPAGAWARDR